MNELDALVSLSSVAAYLGVHRNTVRRISPDELPYYRVGSRGDRRYRPSDVDRYLRRHRGREIGK